MHVHNDFVDRRYTDEELRRIIEDAAQAEVRGEALVHGKGGHTLAEIRDIAQEVGIDPEAVSRVAANMVASEVIPESSPGWFGVPRTVHEQAVIRRPLSTAEMRLAALQAERVLGRGGALRDSGDWVEWRDKKDRLYVGIVRGRSLTRIRAIADQSRELVVGSAVIGLFGIGGLKNALELNSVAGAALSLVIAAATWGVLKFYWRWRSSVTQGHLRELLDIMEDAIPK